jgi:3'-phosphoadenosine 5'-phosphosulfate sulfotransferase (PAPS reductase)/FAD synthetase
MNDLFELLPVIPVPGNRERAVCLSPDVSALLAAGCPVAIGVSGGKDSCACAFAVVEYLDLIGHRGPRLLIHADLGVTEWADSLPTCRRLAERLGLELVIVRRRQGDMMQRWEQRWRDNVRRWETLSCVKLILPWSTPAMRFCTSEMKIDQICRYLVRRFPGAVILNVTGIRRDESTERSEAPVSAPQKKLTSITNRTTGLAWNAIAEWKIGDVFASLEARFFPLHEAYGRWGSSRVSCVACILARPGDHLAAARDERNHAVLLRMVELEIVSTFAFQGSRWLGQSLTHLLEDKTRARLAAAVQTAARREDAESRIPRHLLYTKAWPTCVPTREEAMLLGAVRFAVADAVGLTPTFINPDEIRQRYEQLMELKAVRAKAKSRSDKHDRPEGES